MSDEDSFADALALVQPGDAIVWRNGTYDDQDTIRFEPVAHGTPGAPITFRSETPGGVTFRGNTRLGIGGRHLVVSGFRFDNSDYVFTDDESTGWVIQSRAHSDLARHAYHCRVTDCAIVNYDNPAATSSAKWIQWYGETNRFDHNFVSGKRTRGATFIVELNPTSGGFEAHHTIDHNVFADRPPDPAGANEFETIRTGTSDASDQNAHITVADNYFYRCSGEAEIISNKSAENTYRYNTFVECAGSLTLRHGRGCRVEGNVFFGGNVPDSGGIRLANQDHVVINNYMQDLAGTTYQAALAIMNGTVWNPPASSPDLGGGYVQVKNCVIAHNTIIDAAQSANFGVGNGSSGRSTPPADNTLAANIIVSSNAPLFTLDDTPVNTTYLSNLVWGAATGLPANPNLVVADPMLTPDALGVQRPSAAGPVAGAAGTDLLLPGTVLDMDGAVRPLTGRDSGADQIALGTAPIAPMAITDAGPAWIQSSAPPAVIRDPQDTTHGVGTTVTLSVSATGALPRLFQWRRDGINLIEGGDVSGSDEGTFRIANARTEDGGNYDVVVSNGVGSTTSAVAVVTMFVITYPPRVTTQPESQTAGSGDNARFSVIAEGTAPLHYQWFHNTNTVLPGETNASLTLINVDAGDEGPYHVVVTNLYGTDTSDAAVLTVIPPDLPATITADPSDLTITEGQIAEFGVAAVGTAPLSYQWYFQTSILLVGEADSTLTIPNAQATNAGVYSVVVTNDYGTDTSSFALLTVNPAGPAGSYHWDASSGSAGIQDGSGTWSTNNANWLLNGAGPNVVWDNDGPHDAVFGGGAGGTADDVTVPEDRTLSVRNITFNPPHAGEYRVNAGTATSSVLNVSGTPTFTVADGVFATLKVVLAGTGFTKEGNGTLELGGSTNTYIGPVTVNDGILRVRKSSDGIGCIAAGGVRVNPGGTLQLPKKGQIDDAATITCAGGMVELVSSGGDAFASLVLESGVVTNSDPGTSRSLEMITSIEVQSGSIDGNAIKDIRIDGAAGLTKTTEGTVVLGSGFAGRYTGPTTIQDGILAVNGTIEDSDVVVADGGTLAGTGIVENRVTVQSGGTFSPGESIGTLAVGDLMLAAGSITVVEVSAAGSTSDRVTGFSHATYAGVLEVTNRSGTLAAGHSFQIFDAGGAGEFSSISPPPGVGLAWSFNPASGILSVVSAVDLTPPELMMAISNGQVNVSWPQDHIGWQLQLQTNSLMEGLWTWPAWPGSTATNAVALPIDPQHLNLFLRLSYPPQP